MRQRLVEVALKLETLISVVVQKLKQIGLINLPVIITYLNYVCSAINL